MGLNPESVGDILPMIMQAQKVHLPDEEQHHEDDDREEAHHQ